MRSVVGEMNSGQVLDGIADLQAAAVHNFTARAPALE